MVAGAVKGRCTSNVNFVERARVVVEAGEVMVQARQKGFHFGSVGGGLVELGLGEGEGKWGWGGGRTVGRREDHVETAAGRGGEARGAGDGECATRAESWGGDGGEGEGGSGVGGDGRGRHCGSCLGGA